MLQDVLESEPGYMVRTAGVLALILVLGTRAALAERLQGAFSRSDRSSPKAPAKCGFSSFLTWCTSERRIKDVPTRDSL
jgi:hypothetical protein